MARNLRLAITARPVTIATGEKWTKGVSEAQGMEWIPTREIADVGRIRLRTHQEEPELDRRNHHRIQT
jgi:hypothetical protein